MTKQLFACATDNDGYPTCQGDGTMCARDERGEYCALLPVPVLQCYIEGTQPDGRRGRAVGVVLTAGLDIPDETKSLMVQMGMKSLTYQYPGITDIQVVKDWHEAELPPLDEDDDQ